MNARVRYSALKRALLLASFTTLGGVFRLATKLAPDIFAQGRDEGDKEFLNGGSKMKKHTSVILVFGVLLFAGGLARAELITIAISGQVWYVDDRGGLDNMIQTGDIITGTYTYNTTTSGIYNSNTGRVEYWHYDAPAGITLNIGEFSFSTNPTDIKLNISLKNNIPSGIDAYSLTSNSNLPLSNGAPVEAISWILQDQTGMALDSDDLLLTAFDLTKWNINNLEIFGASRTSQDFYIYGKITTTLLIPEPCMFGLLGLGMLITKKAVRNRVNNSQ